MGKRISVIWSVDKEKLESIVKKSNTLIAIMREIGCDCVTGPRYRDLKKRLKEEEIDYSHIQLGRSHNLGRKIDKKGIPLEKVMVENSTYNRKSLKHRLIRDNILKNECFNCGLKPEWGGKKLVMVLDHINGIRNDHRLENLRLLCPNCNSQTVTFSGRNIKRERKKCKRCDKVISKQTKLGICSDCYLNFHQRKVKSRPDKEQLLKEIEETNYCAVGRKYGVSDNAIRKWLK